MMAPGATLINTTEGNSQDVTVTVFLETDQNTKNEVLIAQLEKYENEQELTHEQLATKQAEKEIYASIGLTASREVESLTSGMENKN